MVKKKNDDLAGIVSEPKGAPEVKPAKSLWPRPHEHVKVEPSLEPAPVPDVKAEPSAPAGDFETVPSEGYQEGGDAKPKGDDEAEPVIAVQPDPDPVAEDQPSISAEPEPLRVVEDDRTASVLEAADEQEPALDDPEDGKTGRIIAMVAGVVVALALGAVALVYGASGLGFKFGEDGETSAGSAPPPAATPVAIANPEELKAAEARIAELQARLEKLEAERSAEAAKAEAPSDTTAAAATPVPTPAPKPPAGQDNATSSPSTPPASASTTAPAPRSDPPQSAAAPEPASPAAPPAAAPAPRPPETARVEQSEPPSEYRPQPSYETPRPTASPEMPVLRGWAVRDVYNGIAVVQGARGPLMEVQPGDDLPGGNRVLAIRRLGGNWAVITEQGIISAR